MLGDGAINEPTAMRAVLPSLLDLSRVFLCHPASLTPPDEFMSGLRCPCASLFLFSFFFSAKQPSHFVIDNIDTPPPFSQACRGDAATARALIVAVILGRPFPAAFPSGRHHVCSGPCVPCQIASRRASGKKKKTHHTCQVTSKYD